MADRKDFPTRAAWIAARAAEHADAETEAAAAEAAAVDLQAEAEALSGLVNELAAASGLPGVDVRCRIAAELDRWGWRAVDLAAILRVGCADDDGE